MSVFYLFTAIELTINKCHPFNKFLYVDIYIFFLQKINLNITLLILICPHTTKNWSSLIYSFVLSFQPLAISSATAACQAWRTHSMTPEATTPRTCARPASVTRTTATSAPTATGSGTMARRERWGRCMRWRRDLEQPAQQGPGVINSKTPHNSGIMTDNDSWIFLTLPWKWQMKWPSAND